MRWVRGTLITMKTTILENSTQSRATRHESGVQFRCAACGGVFDVQTSGATGYACRPDGGLICYPCADRGQRDELRDRSKPFCAYVSGDGKTVTTWTGGKLMDITDSRPCALTRRSYTHSAESYRSIRARDVHGREWAGRGSPGIAIRLRPVGD